MLASLSMSLFFRRLYEHGTMLNERFFGKSRKSYRIVLRLRRYK